MSRRLTSELAACVWIPHFALRAEEARRSELIAQAVAILAPSDSRRLWQVSHHARHLGVRPGMTISQAIGLCPMLVLCEPDPVSYDEQFAQLLLRLSEVSPVIEPMELGRAFVGVDGLEGLYGGPERQLHVIAQAVGRSSGGVGLPLCRGEAGRGGGAAAEGLWEQGWAAVVRLGWGRGKFTAWVAASRAKLGKGIVIRDAERADFLSTQPIAVLPLDADTHRRLQQLGLMTLGALAALPEEAVASQFGREGRLAWRLAAGMVAESVTGREMPEPIVAQTDFPTPIGDREMLIHAIELLVEWALRHPRRTGWRVHTLRLRARLEHGASWLVEATLKDPSADRARIVAPLVTRLQQIPPTGAVEHLAIEFTGFTPGTTELQLFARDAAAAARAGRRSALRTAVHEIKTRLKRSMLSRIIEVHPWSRIPERRYALIDFDP